MLAASIRQLPYELVEVDKFPRLSERRHPRTVELRPRLETVFAKVAESQHLPPVAVKNENRKSRPMRLTVDPNEEGGVRKLAIPRPSKTI